MQRTPTGLGETDRSALPVLMSFLADRLASIETVNWALALDANESAKRTAVLRLVDGPFGRKLAEPWRAAWRLIEEYWGTVVTDGFAEAKAHDIRSRLNAGDRSGSLAATIVRSVAPRLEVSQKEHWGQVDGRPTKRPRTVLEVLSARLISGDVIDPTAMGLAGIGDDMFLAAVANGLEGALNGALDTARNLGWDGENRLYRLGQLYRVYFVPLTQRKAGEHEPDQFHEGIAPCVKLLHFVVERLAIRRKTAAQEVVARWMMTSSPIHFRLWAALSRDPWVTSADEVGRALVALDDRRYWDLQNFPEVAELRALRFAELAEATQQKLAKRLRKLPPRSLWPREADSSQVRRGRLFWSLREFRRIEIGGGNLSKNDKAWVVSKMSIFPQLLQMERLDDGFMGSPQAQFVPPNPDDRYDVLTGEARLSALESALGDARSNWPNDVSERAWDWMRQRGNATKLISDLEVAAHGGAEFPRVWERFGQAHQPVAEEDGEKQKPDLASEARRVLALLEKLPEVTIRQAIGSITNWEWSWRSYTAKVVEGLKVWQRLWPIAVDATNAEQSPEVDVDLNLVARPSSGGREPMDLDTYNTPAGNLVGVFLQACPRIDHEDRPFSAGGTVGAMRDTIISATGRSGLIVRHRLIEALPYFLFADREWTQQHLIHALKEDNVGAISLWRALARNTQYADVLRMIGTQMVERAQDVRLGRETRSSLVFSLVVECLHSFNEGRSPAVPFASVQQMIRSLDDEVRAHAAGAVQRFVHDVSAPRQGEGERERPRPEDLLKRAAVPFLMDVWPQERSLTTPGISKAFADLPATSRRAFESAVDAIQRFLVPFDCWSMLDYGLYDDDESEPKLSIVDDPPKAAAFLRLLDCTVGTAQGSIVPYDLGDALTQIEKVAPGLVQNPVFRRLSVAARR